MQYMKGHRELSSLIGNDKRTPKYKLTISKYMAAMATRLIIVALSLFQVQALTTQDVWQRIPAALTTQDVWQRIPTGTSLSWEHITSRPVVTPSPECVNLQPYQHLLNIKGLDACDPHHTLWQYLDQLSSINWRCRQNIIDVLADRFGYGTNVTSYCNCKTHAWSDNVVQRRSQKALTTMEGVNSECFVQKGCLELKNLYENDLCGVHQIVWDKLKTCPSDIYVEGQAISCQGPIVKKIHEKFNRSNTYNNEHCFCYRTFGLGTVPQDCVQYSGFSSIELISMIPKNCMTHFSIWKKLAMQPAHCQDWIISFMLDKTSSDFTCDCQDPDAASMFGRAVRRRDTSLLPACQRDSQGWNVLQTTFLADNCHSHWYIWRHLAETHGHCRHYLINKMFANFATTSSSCQCKTRLLTDHVTTTPSLPLTTTIPPHTCFQCSGSSCATTGSSIRCETGKDFCMTSIIDQNGSGGLERSIERKCVSKQECDTQDQSSSAYCLQMDKGSFGFAMTCHFCCVGADCNKTPALIPPVATLYSANKP